MNHRNQDKEISDLNFVGVDESGTGSWIGPFFVGCVICDKEFNDTVGLELRDSKKLDAPKRSYLAEKIKKSCIYWSVVEGAFEDIIKKGSRRVWRDCIQKSLLKADKILKGADSEVIIDGDLDTVLHTRIKDSTGLKPEFVRDADTIYPSVMAGAILAKVERDNVVMAFDEECPEYGWFTNKGYGTAAHWEAIQKYGLTFHHRPLSKFKGIPLRKEEFWWRIH